MKKALYILLAVVLVAGGVYGVWYFSRMRQAATRMNGAILLINEGSYPEAIDVIREVLSEYEYRAVTAPSLYLLADTYERAGQYRSAQETYKLLISDTSLKTVDNWWSGAVLAVARLYRKGVCKATVSQKKALVLSIEEFIEKSTQDRGGGQAALCLREAKSRLRTLLISGFDIKVETLTDQAVIRGLYVELGYLLIDLGEYRRAEAALARVDSPISRLGLARLYLKTGEYGKGIGLLEGLLEHDKTGVIKTYYIKNLFDYAEALYEKKKYPQAIELFEKVDMEAPGTTYQELALYRLAEYYYETHDNGKSIRLIDKLLENGVSMKDPDALMMKGFIYYDKREFVRALKVFNEFIKRYPQSDLVPNVREWKAMTERSIKYIG
ncbi:MAG: tetratricopeptide repeat protein [Spirochaetes bacterium]|nr:tetratricopeptide repeat protein [Spirochaetota bacterium]